MLVQLARADGILSKDEVAMITCVAEQKGLSKVEIDALFEHNRHHVPVECLELDESEHFECLHTATQLVKVDGRIYREEICFLRAVFHRFGYEDDVLCHFLINVSAKEDQRRKESLKKYIEEADRAKNS